MISKKQVEHAKKRAADMCRKAGIVLNQREKMEIEVVDEGLNDLEHTGLQIITYVNTERVCAKEIILFPGQTCPEHAHPATVDGIGKEETFRCRWGMVYLYVPGPPSPEPAASPPLDTRLYYTVWHEIVLLPGDQYTIFPDTLHWFQSGVEGAIISEFSTKSTDDTDVFTNPGIQRATVISDDD